MTGRGREMVRVDGPGSGSGGGDVWCLSGGSVSSHARRSGELWSRLSTTTRRSSVERAVQPPRKLDSGRRSGSGTAWVRVREPDHSHPYYSQAPLHRGTASSLVVVTLSERSGGNESAVVFLCVGWTWWTAGAYDGRGAGGGGRDERDGTVTVTVTGRC